MPAVTYNVQNGDERVEYQSTNGKTWKVFVESHETFPMIILDMCVWFNFISEQKPTFLIFATLKTFRQITASF